MTVALLVYSFESDLLETHYYLQGEVVEACCSPSPVVRHVTGSLPSFFVYSSSYLYCTHYPTHRGIKSKGAAISHPDSSGFIETALGISIHVNDNLMRMPPSQSSTFLGVVY
jgi:hypothetical protein